MIAILGNLVNNQNLIGICRTLVALTRVFCRLSLSASISHASPMPFPLASPWSPFGIFGQLSWWKNDYDGWRHPVQILFYWHSKIKIVFAESALQDKQDWSLWQGFINWFKNWEVLKVGEFPHYVVTKGPMIQILLLHFFAKLYEYTFSGEHRSFWTKFSDGRLACTGAQAHRQ